MFGTSLFTHYHKENQTSHETKIEILTIILSAYLKYALERTDGNQFC